MNDMTFADPQTDMLPCAPDGAKEKGAFYTPEAVVQALLHWAVRGPTDRLLDPACGDGRFLAGHPNSVGIEQDVSASSVARLRAPGAWIHEGDFFAWAVNTEERFDCAAGNPPFIRYQRFDGEVRRRALDLCARLGAAFTGLSASWPMFLVATASLLKPGGRMAFVVPAEIGHAPYSAPLLDYLVAHFARVQVVAIWEKLFPDLSQDCWLLYAEGFGGRTDEIGFTTLDRFAFSVEPPRPTLTVPVSEWREVWNRRLRPMLLSRPARDLYREIAEAPSTRRLGDIARIGIGYVTGANDFFHLRPSEAEQWAIPAALLHPSVRKAQMLPADRLTPATLETWRREDAPFLLLRLGKNQPLPSGIAAYLESDAGQAARRTTKCRTRAPWYSVPGVTIPDFFLTYMSGRRVGMVKNDAGCSCTNSVLAVQLRDRRALQALLDGRGSSLFQLSWELEGHPLGGGMLKLEPGEANRVLLPWSGFSAHVDAGVVAEAVAEMQAWRHYTD